MSADIGRSHDHARRLGFPCRMACVGRSFCNNGGRESTRSYGHNCSSGAQTDRRGTNNGSRKLARARDSEMAGSGARNPFVWWLRRPRTQEAQAAQRHASLTTAVYNATRAR
ncbi:hypothetical protein MRX96_042263 [Rhipicephalus microplus]